MKKLILIIIAFSCLVSCSSQTKDAEYYTKLGRTNCGKGNYLQGMQNYAKAIEIDSNYIAAYVDRALWRWRYKDYNGSIMDWKKVLSLKPEHRLALNNLGIVYESTGDLDSALIYYNKCIEIDSLAIGSYYNRANIYFAQGKLELAINDYKKNIDTDTLTTAISFYMCDINKLELGDSVNGKIDIQNAREFDSLIESKMIKHVQHLKILRRIYFLNIEEASTL